jgi:uncharacterized protein (TIGR02145 family)
VEPVGANYANKTVSFRVWWNAGSRDATHLSTVWVWVDYIKTNSNNTTSGNTWTRADVSAASPTASISYDGSNRNGFWLQGNASTNYSATLTVQLNITETKFNWCAYASDYPPNVMLDKGTYTFKGTPSFLVSSHAQPLTGKTIAKASLTVNSQSTFTDATECPGIGSLYCPYTGSDLYMDATHLCQRRTSGANNWETWIRDTRDNKMYRIVYMPDNKWWMAQNLDYRKDLEMNASVALPSTASGNGIFGIGTYWCYDNSVANCNTYGPLYTFETVMMVDGRCSSEDAATRQGSGTCTIGAGWVEPVNSYCTGTSSSDANCAKNLGRGIVITSGGGAGGGRGICPVGWHVPTELEWGLMLNKAESNSNSTLHTNCAGYSCGTDAGIRLMANSSLWVPNYGTDVFGFSTLTSGYRGSNGIAYSQLTECKHQHASSSAAAEVSWSRVWSPTSNYDMGKKIGRHSNVRSYGFGVRCVHD